MIQGIYFQLDKLVPKIINEVLCASKVNLGAQIWIISRDSILFSNIWINEMNLSCKSP